MRSQVVLDYILNITLLLITSVHADEPNISPEEITQLQSLLSTSTKFGLRVPLDKQLHPDKYFYTDERIHSLLTANPGGTSSPELKDTVTLIRVQEKHVVLSTCAGWTVIYDSVDGKHHRCRQCIQPIHFTNPNEVPVYLTDKEIASHTRSHIGFATRRIPKDEPSAATFSSATFVCPLCLRYFLNAKMRDEHILQMDHHLYAYNW